MREGREREREIKSVIVQHQLWPLPLLTIFQEMPYLYMQARPGVQRRALSARGRKLKRATKVRDIFQGERGGGGGGAPPEYLN